jgi:uncharacterized protein YdaU (DUF1376 family)
MSLPFMPFYVGDYLADTGHLSTIEHGAYLLLIMHYWRTGALPKDEAVLMRICRMNKREWDRYRDSLQALFRPDWSHKRIDAELDKGRQKSAARSQSGKTGAAIKSLKNRGTPQAIASVLLKQPEPESESEESPPLRSGDSCGEERSPYAVEGEIYDETAASANGSAKGGSNSLAKPGRPAKPAKPKTDDIGEILHTCLTPQMAADLIAHRKAKRAPITAGAARLLVKSFEAFGNPELAAQTMIVRGWTGFEPGWIMDAATRAAPSAAHGRANGYDTVKPQLDLMRAAAARGPKTDVSGI